MGHSGASTDPITFDAHFTLPNGEDSSFQFTITEDSGTSCTLTAPTGFSSSNGYVVSATAKSGILPVWTVTSGCTITYASTVTGALSSTDVSFFTETNSGLGM